tara:strand:+ start:7919 stop:8068 length:150 start_codon:yes stop_codon:yes gene_type:complete
LILAVNPENRDRNGKDSYERVCEGNDNRSANTATEKDLQQDELRVVEKP